MTKRSTPAPATAGPAITKACETELSAERATEASLQSRALNVITSSGGFVTLALALVAAITGRKDYHVPDSARICIALGLVLFVAAAVLALITLQVRRQSVLTVETLEKWTSEEAWGSPSDVAQRIIAASTIPMIKDTRRQNGIRATHLQRAILAELGAIALLAVGILFVLRAG
jgi:hypothetical protein